MGLAAGETKCELSEQSKSLRRAWPPRGDQNSIALLLARELPHLTLRFPEYCDCSPKVQRHRRRARMRRLRETKLRPRILAVTPACSTHRPPARRELTWTTGLFPHPSLGQSRRLG